MFLHSAYFLTGADTRFELDGGQNGRLQRIRLLLVRLREVGHVGQGDVARDLLFDREPRLRNRAQTRELRVDLEPADTEEALKAAGYRRGHCLPEQVVCAGGEDALVPPQSTEPMADLPTVERVVYPDLRHETLNEPEGPQVVTDVIAWINARI